MEGSEDRNLNASTKAEIMEESCLLVCSSGLVQSVFLQLPGPYAQGWHRPQEAGPSHINH